MPIRAGITALVLALLFLSFPVFANSPESPTPTDPEAQAKADYQEALKQIQAGRNDEALPLLEQALKGMPEDRHLQADYAQCLVWTGAWQKAIEFYGPREKELRQIRYLPRQIAKAYYELKEYSKALELYRLGLTYDPKDEEALKGIVYSYLRMGDGAGAYTAWLETKKTGQVSEKTLDAVKLVLLEQYGASLEALVVAKDGKVGQPAELESLALDRAVTKLRWGLVDEAIAELEAVLEKDPGNLRARGDYIVALRQKDRMNDALAQFEIYRRSGVPISYWVSQAVADAYIYLHKPEEAEVYYKMTLEKDPENFGAMMGLFYVYTDLRQWQKASQMLGRLNEQVEKQKKALAWNESVLAKQRYVADYNSLVLARGWFLLYQDQLKEGQEYLSTTSAKPPRTRTSGEALLTPTCGGTGPGGPWNNSISSRRRIPRTTGASRASHGPSTNSTTRGNPGRWPMICTSVFPRTSSSPTSGSRSGSKTCGTFSPISASRGNSRGQRNTRLRCCWKSPSPLFSASTRRS